MLETIKNGIGEADCVPLIEKVILFDGDELNPLLGYARRCDKQHI